MLQWWGRKESDTSELLNNNNNQGFAFSQSEEELKSLLRKVKEESETLA